MVLQGRKQIHKLRICGLWIGFFGGAEAIMQTQLRIDGPRLIRINGERVPVSSRSLVRIQVFAGTGIPIRRRFVRWRRGKIIDARPTKFNNWTIMRSLTITFMLLCSAVTA
jgi:hypothetical protein